MPRLIIFYFFNNKRVAFSESCLALVNINSSIANCSSIFILELCDYAEFVLVNLDPPLGRRPLMDGLSANG